MADVTIFSLCSEFNIKIALKKCEQVLKEQNPVH